ncbi:MAG: TRAFs-binding domain-containing protein [Nannocystaceae bacterium]
MKPVCFMIMPFRRKAVRGARAGAPAEVDYDRLWDVAYRPVLIDLGYLPVRADLESTSVIVKDMLNRLKHADLVLADVSLPNGNVYYELGVRHVAQETNCVQVAASWFSPLFDIKQFRTITFPLKDGDISDAEAANIRKILGVRIREFGEARTPYHELVDTEPEQAFADTARRISEFQSQLSELRLMEGGAARAERIETMVRENLGAAKIMPDVALELLYLLRDANSWRAARDFVDALPTETAFGVEAIAEQYCLALSELGEHEKSIARLEQMNRKYGPSAERCGIIGGRFKRKYRDARAQRRGTGATDPSASERAYLQKAIASYKEGMQLDLNGYYCACNLPGLLRSRNRRGDEEAAGIVEVLVIAACRRAKTRNHTDPWLNNTLLGTAFRRGDLDALENLALEVEGGVGWRLASTLADTDDWIRQAPIHKKAALMSIRDRLVDVLASKEPCK